MLRDQRDDLQISEFEKDSVLLIASCGQDLIITCTLIIGCICSRHSRRGWGGGKHNLDQTGMCHQLLKFIILFWSGKTQKGYPALELPFLPCIVFNQMILPFPFSSVMFVQKSFKFSITVISLSYDTCSAFED